MEMLRLQVVALVLTGATFMSISTASAQDYDDERATRLEIMKIQAQRELVQAQLELARMQQSQRALSRSEGYRRPNVYDIAARQQAARMQDPDAPLTNGERIANFTPAPRLQYVQTAAGPIPTRSGVIPSSLRSRSYTPPPSQDSGGGNFSLGLNLGPVSIQFSK